MLLSKQLFMRDEYFIDNTQQVSGLNISPFPTNADIYCFSNEVVILSKEKDVVVEIGQTTSMSEGR